jgi:C2 domain
MVTKITGEDGRSLLLVKIPSSALAADVILRPATVDLDKWFAALYRWRTITRSASSRSLKSVGSSRSMSPSGGETNMPRRPLDVKIGSMVLLPNKRVKAILKDNGVLSILAEASIRGEEESLLYCIHLYSLQRSAIQLISPSLTSQPYSILICASLREQGTKPYEMKKMTLYLGLDSRLQMEVWYVLLKCYAAPELYGPPSPNPTDSFRCHRSLWLRVAEGRRIHRPVNAGDSMREKGMDLYCEVYVEDDLRGRTGVKKGTLRPRWTEDFYFRCVLAKRN